MSANDQQFEVYFARTKQPLEINAEDEIGGMISKASESI